MNASLKLAFRSIITGRWYSLVSVAGLSLALAVVLLVSVLILFETSFDRDFRYSDSIHRVTWVNTGTGDHFATMFNASSPQMKIDFPEVEEVARLGIFELTLQSAGESIDSAPGTVRFENLAAVDPSFFSMFDFEFIGGDPDSLNQPDSIVMTRAGAERYFPGVDPLGQNVTVQDEVVLTVRGVIENLPRNTHFTSHYFVPVEVLRTLYDGAGWLESWNSDRFYHYLRLAEGASPSKLESVLPDFLLRHNPDWTAGAIEPRLQALTDLHFITGMQDDMPVRDSVQGLIKAPRQASDLWLFAAGAVFLALVASFNFMNLQIARSMGKGKQVGMLKVLGANRRQVIAQILTESLLLSGLALLIALLLVELTLLRFGELLAVEVRWIDLLTPEIAIIAVLMTVGLAILSGAYPAVLMTSQRPTQIMRGTFKLGPGGARVRSVLVLLQFAVSVVLIVVSLVIFAQIRYSLNVPLGFSPERVAVVQMGRSQSQHFESMKSRLELNPDVELVTRSSKFPGDHLSDGSTLTIVDSRDELAMRSVWAGYDYFETLGMEIVAGRGFSRDYPADLFQMPTAESPEIDAGLIINEAAARKAGWMTGNDASAAIGKDLFVEWAINGLDTTMRYKVVGVVGDVHFRSLRYEVVPMQFSLTGHGSRMGIRFSPNLPRNEAEELMLAAWREVAGDIPLRHEWLEDTVSQLYAQEHRSLQLVSTISLLAILVACMGLFAVATLVTSLRTREIGLRKILGAGVREVVNLLSWQFLKPVLLANLVAWPLAWLYLDGWLQNFAYRIDLSWLHFLVPGLLALLIAWITVAGQALKVATDSPIKALRYE